jgi:tRNA dimethylallyltransferase
MDPSIFDNTLILTGPTASGKTAVGVALAERLNAEIISMDSMALYRGMDIGTAKPSSEERRRVRHHLIDVLDPSESSSLAWWLDQAASCCREIESRGKRVFFVGGTPLYLKAILRGIFEGPAADSELRRKLEQQSGPVLHGRLSQLDPAAARRIHPNDLRRLVRALEVLELTGRPISEWQRQFKQVRPRSTPAVWLDWPRPQLYDRIDQRVEQMLERGLFEEVKKLAALPRPLGKEARQALGYKELLDHLDGKEGWGMTVERIKTRSRNFAKRQLTWFRSLAECRAAVVREEDDSEAVIERVSSCMCGRPNPVET